MRSEILDNYYKIAVESGLIEKSAYPDSKDYKSGFKDGRQGSDDISTIQALYGISPNGKEDDTDITDKAHPTTITVSPAYDKFNGVVENSKERQAAMHEVANKLPNGNLTQRRYVEAAKDLLSTLVSTGFLMDNRNEEKLRILADSCSESLVKTSQSSSWFPSLGRAGRSRGFLGMSGGVWAGIGLTAAAILGGYWALKHKDTFDQGTAKNFKQVVATATDAAKDATGTAQTLIEEVKENAEQISTAVDELREAEITKASTPEEVKAHVDAIKAFKDLAKLYKANLAKLMPVLEQYEVDDKKEPSGEFMAMISKIQKGMATDSIAKFKYAASTAGESLDKELSLLASIDKAAGLKASSMKTPKPPTGGADGSSTSEKSESPETPSKPSAAGAYSNL